MYGDIFQARIRAATRTLIIIVCTYLMSNLLSVIITIWEYLDAESLFQRYLSFYVLSVDSISLLTIVASCLRLPIYVTCQPLLRKEMYQFICEFNERSSPSKFLRSRGSRQSPIGLFPIVSFYQMCPTTHALKGFHLRFVHLVDMILISK
ncbi:unnamed protein product [Heligmosomoides polygyrus]|uniref:G_PROTEIN_RECEP_F1_2 domain-containing protein n=1 Tax=Heligmosomoides polygyrus TaxID=6339 RepID=A0A183GQX2_HELPZ|nr:unnamed protein product [Heligmosomoides polygyrus]